jgi:hypothetical protein
MARYEVEELDRFLEVFDGFEEARRRAGSTGHWVLRPPDEPRQVVVLIRFGSPGEAEAFAGSAEREESLGEAGVVAREDEILAVERAPQGEPG